MTVNGGDAKAEIEPNSCKLLMGGNHCCQTFKLQTLVTAGRPYFMLQDVFVSSSEKPA